MLHALALAALVARCAPAIATHTMTAIVRVESGGDPLAIGDNTAKRSYSPQNRAEAEALAQQLIAAGHSVDLGIAQIDVVNFARLSMSARALFDPCLNLRAGATILLEDYNVAERRYGSGQIALRHAIGMYNTGRLDRGASYERRVLAIAGISDPDQLSKKVDVAFAALRSPLLVRVSTAQRRSQNNHRRSVTPLRAPILITARPSRVLVF
jgi:type IV secretion system protein VirB1